MTDHQLLLRDALRKVTAGERLACDDAESMVNSLTQVDLENPAFAALAAGILCAMRARGEEVDEIVGAVRCLKNRQIRVGIDVGEGETLLDTCGTGGDGVHLINISTLAALVVASLGVKVAKHGNRSVSSACGSADLLEALGYPLSSEPSVVSGQVTTAGFGFLFAPHFHPALKNLAALRRTLGVRTLFNIIGPLVNPAGVTHQLLGVYARELVEPLAWATGRLGLRRALIVHGEGGLDELCPWGTTWVALSEAGGAGVQQWEWTPQSFGAPSVSLESLRGGDAEENAALAQELLNGGRPEMAAAVAMNAAAALWLTESETDLHAGYARAYEALRKGAVGRYLEDILARLRAPA